MKKILNNKKGVSYIWTCVIILVTVMFIMIGTQYAYVYHVVRTQKEETKLKLDGYVTKYTIEKFDSIKQGETFEETIDKSKLVAGAYATLGIPRTNGQIPPIAKEKYTMVSLQITPLTNHEFGVIFKYKIVIPFQMFNKDIADITVPITIVSAYTQK